LDLFSSPELQGWWNVINVVSQPRLPAV